MEVWGSPKTGSPEFLTLKLVHRASCSLTIYPLSVPIDWLLVPAMAFALGKVRLSFPPVSRTEVYPVTSILIDLGVDSVTLAVLSLQQET